MRTLKFTVTIIVFILLTVLTQTGGLVYLVSFSTYPFINKKAGNKNIRWIFKLASFIILYSLATFIVVPAIARPFGRVALPLSQTAHVKPLNFLTCFLNRNYVRPELKDVTLEVAKQMNSRYPGTVINYLDANFPFFNDFPLLPHLSHSDGKKLDLAFCYIDKKTRHFTNDVPSVIGYGIGEEPVRGEVNTADLCAKQGRWQYSFLKKIVPQGKKSDFIFDGKRTKELIDLFAAEAAIEKIFIEPHLKVRLALKSDKIRFHGCQAVRHDDHVHIQIR